MMRACLLLSFGAAAIAAPAVAQTPREAEMQGRLEQLEAAVAALRAELAASHAAPAAPPPPPSAPQVAAASPPAPAPAGLGFQVGGTTIRLGGFFKATASVMHFGGGIMPNDSAGRDFYQPTLTPIGGAGDSHATEFNAKQTRILLTTSTPVGAQSVNGTLEFDFQAAPGTQGNQRATNAWTPSLRRAFLTYGDARNTLLAGQEWTTWQALQALPESTDYIGAGEGTVFVRQTQVRYTHALSPHASLSVAVENPETAFTTRGQPTAIAGAGNDRLPDLAARLDVKPRFGEFSLGAVLRRLTVVQGTLGDSATGWGVSAAGRVPFPGSRYNDLRFMVTHGSGIGRYVGVNLLPDAVFGTADGGRLKPVTLTAATVSGRIGWFGTLRSTLGWNVQTGHYDAAFMPADASHGSWSAFGNLFFSPVPALDVGIEYRHARRELNSGAAGALDRGEMGIRYNF